MFSPPPSLLSDSHTSVRVQGVAGLPGPIGIDGVPGLPGQKGEKVKVIPIRESLLISLKGLRKYMSFSKFRSKLNMFFQGQNSIGIQGIQGPRGEPGEKVKERTENLRIE